MNDTLKIKVVNSIISDAFEYGSNDSANFFAWCSFGNRQCFVNERGR